MAKRIPGPHDELVLPIQRADQEIKSSLQDILDHLRRLTGQVNPHYIIGFALVARCEAEGCNLEAELRKAADALANWRKVSQDLSEERYYELHSANEKARKEKMKEKRRKGRSE